MVRRLSLIVLCILFLACTAHAGIMQHPSGLQIWIPNTWSTETDGDLLMTNSPDEGAIVIMFVVQARDLNMAINELDKELGKVIQNAKPTSKPQKLYIHGVNGVGVNGVGNVDGEAIAWGAGLFKHRGNVLMVLGFTEAGKLATYNPMLQEILHSLQPY